MLTRQQLTDAYMGEPGFSLLCDSQLAALRRVEAAVRAQCAAELRTMARNGWVAKYGDPLNEAADGLESVGEDASHG